MKLTSHYNKVSITVSISVLLAGALIYFFTIGNVIRQQLDRSLAEEVSEVFDYVQFRQQLPAPIDFSEDQIRFTKTNSHPVKGRFYDTVYSDPKTGESKAGRAAEGSLRLKGDAYKYVIVISREGTENLAQLIAIITFSLMTILLLILFLANRYLLNDLWEPFYRLLEGLRRFSVSEPSSYTFMNTRVDEFRELDKVIYSMSERVKSDFRDLRQLTENASHEMRTPLAVITSKLDTLIQDETLNPKQYDQIDDIYRAAAKLSKLYQSLMLLVKIENRLIPGSETLRLDLLIQEKISQFHELALSHELSFAPQLSPAEISASRYLADILLNNLFSNAIRHNISKGRIIIDLTKETLLIGNTGPDAPLNQDTIFNRFEKGKGSEGTGLGLTIIKNICIVYKWEVSYSYKNNLHTFIVKFGSQRPSVP